MSVMWPCRSRPIAAFLMAAAWFVIGPAALTAQTAPTKIRALLTESSQLTADEITALDSGKAVVKALPTANKQETAVIGILRLSDMNFADIAIFRESLAQRRGSERTSGGKFSSPPQIDDLAGLELENKDFEELQKCVVGRCDMNLSANAIRRFQKDVNWNTANRNEQATALMRQVLLEYAVNYLEKGDKALGSYDNSRKPVNLAETHNDLLASSGLANELVPELTAFLKRFPADPPDGIQNELHWSIVDFGLKPMVTLTHTAAYSAPADSGPKLLAIAARQIYAGRYLDASLSFSILVHDTDTSGTFSFVIFMDRSRSDALGGLFDSLTRSVVEREASERVQKVLQTAQNRLETEKRRKLEPSPVSDTSGNATPENKSFMIAAVLAALLITAVLAFYLLRRK
ncbi:MAG: hypothetical protein KF685_02435 [Acidobacteria bacterium]|nr:hypothetical protein [Acidobacteriota bacterium]